MNKIFFNLCQLLSIFLNFFSNTHLLNISHIQITIKGAIKETIYPKKHVHNGSKWRKKKPLSEKKKFKLRTTTDGSVYQTRIEKERRESAKAIHKERDSRVRLKSYHYTWNSLNEFSKQLASLFKQISWKQELYRCYSWMRVKIIVTKIYFEWQRCNSHWSTHYKSKLMNIPVHPRIKDGGVKGEIVAYSQNHI